MKTLKDVKIQDILPQNLKKDPNIYALSEACNPLFSYLQEKAKSGSIFANLDDLPGDVLDHIALQLAVNPWRDSWDIEFKRNAIKASPEIKRTKGTMYAIERALNALGSRSKIIEWQNQTPPGTPGTFNIEVMEFPESNTPRDAQEDIIIAINNAKPASRHYTLIFKRVEYGVINVSIAARAVTLVKL